MQVLRANPNVKSFGERLNIGLRRGLDTAKEYYQMAEEKNKNQKFREQAKALYNLDIPEGMSTEDAAKLTIEAYKQKAKFQNQQDLIKQFGLGEYFGEQTPNEQPTEDQTPFDWEVDELVTNKPKEGKNEEQLKQGKQPLKEKVTPSKKLIPESKIAAMALVNKPAADVMQKHNDNIMKQQRHEETISEQRRNQLRQETLPLRKEIADKASAAREGIQNKNHLLDLIKRGNMDDPTFAALASSLPLNLGKRLLSNDTVEYKAGLIEEFGDLKNLFKGATRVKEIELLEEKIADIYLTDAQKETILNSRLLALQADVIRAEAAAELEDEPLSVLQFEKAVDERAKPKLEALFNRVIDQQKAVIQDAENRKQIPLNPKDPEDLKIMQQIKKEAGNDKEKAKALAKKKGYVW